MIMIWRCPHQECNNNKWPVHLITQWAVEILYFDLLVLFTSGCFEFMLQKYLMMLFGESIDCWQQYVYTCFTLQLFFFLYYYCCCCCFELYGYKRPKATICSKGPTICVLGLPTITTTNKHCFNGTVRRS